MNIFADVYDAIDEGKFIKGDAIPSTGYTKCLKLQSGETDSL